MSVRDLLLPHLTRNDAVSAGALDVGRLTLEGHESAAALWNFAVNGGACGEAEASAFVATVRDAIASRRPLVTVLATGGTKLTEGMRALVGIPRMSMALDELRTAGMPHICIADNPTTGGVWVAVGCAADLRAGVAGATVAFSGPRVVEAMTGAPPALGTGTAEAALAAGLLDAVLTADEIPRWLTRALAAVDGAGETVDQSDTDSASKTLDGRILIDELLTDSIDIAGADESVYAAIGRFGSRQVDSGQVSSQGVVGVALASAAAALVSTAGFDLLARAARLADTINVPLVIAVDTLGGDPHDAGVPTAIGRAMSAVLACRAPTITLVHGAGGSGGALAGAVTDKVLVGPSGWFAALAPGGAAAALRRDLDDVIDILRLTPAELLVDGFADELYADGDERAAVTAALVRLGSIDPTERLDRRDERWSGPLRPR